MRKQFLAMMLAITSSLTMANDLIQEQSISEVTRRSGGATYTMELDRVVNNVVLTMEAELVDPNNNRHKLQIYSIHYQTVNGQNVQVSGERFLTGSDGKISLSMNSNEGIKAILVKAESWRAYHSIFVSVEGRISSTPTQPDIQDPVPAPPSGPSDDDIRRQQEEEARRREEERQREIQREVARRMEEQRQQQCRADLIGRIGFPGVQAQADNCFSMDIPEVNRVLTRTERRMGRLTSRLDELNAPLRQCNKKLTAHTSAAERANATYNAKANTMAAGKSNISKQLNDVRVAADQGEMYKCTLTNVGKKGRGVYSGQGETKAKAVMAAFMTCPNRKNDGCGDQDRFRGNISCQKLR